MPRLWTLTGALATQRKNAADRTNEGAIENLTRKQWLKFPYRGREDAMKISQEEGTAVQEHDGTAGQCGKAGGGSVMEGS